MPLYLEDFPPSTYSYPMAAVLTMMALDVEDRPINPSTAADLIRHFVGLMVPPEHRPVLDIEGQPTWDKVELVQYRLLSAAGEHQLEQLAQAYFVVALLYHHSTRPPREAETTMTALSLST